MSAIWLITHYAWHDVEVQGWLLMAAISGLLAIIANQWDINGNPMMEGDMIIDRHYLAWAALAGTLVAMFWAMG